MVKFEVRVKVLYDDVVYVELPENATRDEIVAAANAKYKEEGSDSVDYAEHVFPDKTWTISCEDDPGKYFPPPTDIYSLDI